jgi:DNA-binding NarL/FixJ family response regulator
MGMSADTTTVTTPNPIRVAVVDDHESVRLGLQLACTEAGYEFVVAAPTIAQFLVAIAGRECDVVVLDLSLGDGSSVTQNVKAAQGVGAAVLIHSIADRVGGIREALSAGAAGVIPKSAPTSVVIAAIATVARGEGLNNLEWANAIDADRDFARVNLGAREREVLHLYASGLPLTAVAERLGIAHSTAREYLGRIRSKYVDIGRPAPDKLSLLRRAVEDGILPELGADPQR